MYDPGGDKRRKRWANWARQGERDEEEERDEENLRNWVPRKKGRGAPRPPTREAPPAGMRPPMRGTPPPTRSAGPPMGARPPMRAGVGGMGLRPALGLPPGGGMGMRPPTMMGQRPMPPNMGNMPAPPANIPPQLWAQLWPWIQVLMRMIAQGRLGAPPGMGGGPGMRPPMGGIRPGMPMGA